MESLQDWPSHVQSILHAGDTGQEAVWEAAVAAARQIAGADGAAVVRWAADGPRILAREGSPIRLPERRPATGSSFCDGEPMAAVSFGNQTDLVVVRAARGGPFAPATLEALRAITILSLHAGGYSHMTLSALLDVATKLLATHEQEEVFLAVANAAIQVLQAEIAGILLTDSTHEVLEMRCAVGHRTVETAHLRVLRGQGLAGKVLETNRPERVDDYVTDRSITKEFLSVASREGTQSALCAPMTVQGRTTGVVCVWRRRRSLFTDEDVRVMIALAGLASIAVQSARLHEAEQRAGAALRSAHGELEQRYRDAAYVIRVLRELARIAVDEEDLEPVIGAVTSLTGCRATLVDHDLTRLAGEDDGLDERVARRILSDSAGAGKDNSSQVVEINTGTSWTLAAPMRMAEATLGFLCLEGFERPPRSVDKVVVTQAATVCALLLAREEATITTMRRLQSEFVWDLLEGRIPDHTQAMVRARYIRHGFALPARVILIQLEGKDTPIREAHERPQELERARSRAAQLLSDRISDLSSTRPVVAHRADLFAALVPRPEQDSTRRVRRLGEAVATQPLRKGAQQFVGISGPVDSFSRFPDGMRQAQLSLSACHGDRPAVAYEELGVVQFLLAPTTRTELLEFAQGILGPLIEYDRARGTDLVRSLATYLSCDCKLKPAADRAFVHHKTMRYRLNRVEELAELDLSRQEDRFNAQLALKILDLGSTEPELRA
jgi:sugar diacid utilization regulator/putative methionine-R-sulfoxide reductase with GAF domain